jgi:O-antigen ligase
MSGEILDRWCERGILVLVLAILVIGPLAFGATRVPGFFAVEVLTLGVLVLWGLRLWLNPRPRLLWPPVCWAALAFLLYAIARYLYSDIEYIARLELVHVIVYVLLFFMILNNLHRQEAVQVISVTMVFLAMLISFYALYQFVTGSDRVWYMIKPYPHRGSGTYICPNHLGGFLEMLLPLGLAYTLPSRLNTVTKILLGYASLIILAGIAATVSRGSWVSTGVALLAFFTLLACQRGHRLPAFVFLVLILGAGVYFVSRSPIFRIRVQQIGVPKHVEADSRVLIWQAALAVWRENPWWGVGPAHFDYRFGQHRPGEVQLRPVRAHNDFLNTLTDWGVVGAGIVASACVLLIVGVFKTWRFVRGSVNDLGGGKNRNRFAFVLGASAGLLAILVHSAVDFNMHIPANAIMAICLMALLSSHLRFATEKYWFGIRALPKVVISGGLAIAVIYLGQQGIRQVREYAFLRSLNSAPTFSPAMVKQLAQAFSVEPTNPDTAATIGECYRVQSAEGGPNYRELADQAMEWFERSMKLNPWSAYAYLQYGTCLDWVDRQDESQSYFDRAIQLDPNNYYTLDGVGLHYVQLQDYAAARPWFERSLRLEWQDNPIARNYLLIVERRLLEAATNEVPISFTPSAR